MTSFFLSWYYIDSNLNKNLWKKKNYMKKSLHSITLPTSAEFSNHLSTCHAFSKPKPLMNAPIVLTWANTACSTPKQSINVFFHVLFVLTNKQHFPSRSMSSEINVSAVSPHYRVDMLCPRFKAVQIRGQVNISSY